MPLHEDLNSEVTKIFRESWTERDGQVVPSSENVQLGNDAINLDATVLYADMADSTKLVDTYKKMFAAEIYKAFLHCSAKIIRSNGGEITAYDGDRIMAVFIGDTKNSNAANAALKINYARCEIINPALKKQYPNTSYQASHLVGIDTSKLFIARTGIRGANDLVWVGRAANHAAKMSSLPSSYSTYISSEVFDRLNEHAKYSTDGKIMWEKATWTEMNRTIYRSTWWRKC